MASRRICVGISVKHVSMLYGLCIGWQLYLTECLPEIRSITTHLYCINVSSSHLNAQRSWKLRRNRPPIGQSFFSSNTQRWRYFTFSSLPNNLRCLLHYVHYAIQIVPSFYDRRITRNSARHALSASSKMRYTTQSPRIPSSSQARE